MFEIGPFEQAPSSDKACYHGETEFTVANQASSPNAAVNCARGVGDATEVPRRPRHVVADASDQVEHNREPTGAVDR